MMLSNTSIQSARKGIYLPVILMISTLFMALCTATIALAMANLKTANNHRDKVSALEIAEAGVNYYLWRLSHFNTDYCDGQSCNGNAADGYGPYTHNFQGISGTVVGTYELKIFPPTADRSSVRIESTGRVNGRLLDRKIICELGMPSYTKYTLFSQPSPPSNNALSPELWIGPSEKVAGSVFANLAGIYNQGEITKDTSSTMEKFNSLHGGVNIDGVSGQGIFGGAKIFPATPIDTNKVDVDIVKLRDAAKLPSGFYRDASGANGYHVVLRENNFSLYRVTQVYGTFELDSVNDANDLSILQETQTKKLGNNQVADPLLGTFSYPASGVMAFEDNIWVSGRIDNQRITIMAADPEESRSKFMKNIVVPDNILYTNYNGLDKVGLVTQRYVLAPRKAPANLEIDAAIIALSSVDSSIQIKKYCSSMAGDYNTNCSDDHKAKIRVFGSMAHRSGLLWRNEYVDLNGAKTGWSGFQEVETVTDESNVLRPPPQFPMTGSYQILSWREE